LKAVLDMLKRKNKFEKMEGYSIFFMLIGALILASGIGLSILNTKGISAIMAMLGSVLAFFAMISLILTWLIKELIGE